MAYSEGYIWSNSSVGKVAQWLWVQPLHSTMASSEGYLWNNREARKLGFKRESRDGYSLVSKVAQWRPGSRGFNSLHGMVGSQNNREVRNLGF